MPNRLLRYLRVCLLLVAVPLAAAGALSPDETAQIIQTTVAAQKTAWGMGQNEPLLASREQARPGDSFSDWWAVALGRSGIKDNYGAYLSGLQTYVEGKYSSEGGLHRVKATEWHRIALAVMALGGDPTAFGTTGDGTSIDLIADGTYAWNGTAALGQQGLNAWIFALITLDALDFAIPDDAPYAKETILTQILQSQNADGGFGLDKSGGSGPDITAMALQALAPLRDSDTRYPCTLFDGTIVQRSVSQVIDKALEYLSGVQLEGGDFASGDTPSAESTAQVLIALCALDIDPETDTRFIRQGATVLDGLLRYRLPGGLFAHTQGGKPDGLAAGQSLLALEAYRRMKTGAPRLYDMRGGLTVNAGDLAIVIWAAVAWLALVVTAVVRIQKKRKCASDE